MFFVNENGFIQTKKPVPNFRNLTVVERDKKDIVLFTDDELIAEAKAGYGFKSRLSYDVESYPNYWLCAFKSLESGKVIYFEMSPDSKLDRAKFEWVLTNFCIIGYNCFNYDDFQVRSALTNVTTLQLHKLTEDIIKNNLRRKELEKEHSFKYLPTNQIDLIEVAPGADTIDATGTRQRISLKTYGARLHAPRLQDLPFKPGTYLTREQAETVRLYCINDLDLTIMLYRELEQQIKLREQMGLEYKQDLRSKSDAQIAEAVISNEVKNMNGYFARRPKIEAGTVFKYFIPDFVKYQTPQLQKMLEIIRNEDFIISNGGGFLMPEAIKNTKIRIGTSVYRMGLGGLHSSEKSVSHKSDENTILIDRDVESYYPRTILNLELFPSQMGKTFLKVYDNIVTRRLIAKKNKDKVTADSLKITINGSFGKLGSCYSSLYAPQLMIQVTITGQLALLMLIEAVEGIGIPVVSANTDGIVIKCPRSRENDLLAVISMWEQVTGYKTEETRYAAIFSKDVNNYFAAKYKFDEKQKIWLDELESKPDARYLDERLGIKAKGVYCERGSALNSVLSKNPEHIVCSDAVLMLLRYGTPIEETIMNCKDIRRFVSTRSVAGGGYKDEVYLGKVVRWYYALNSKGEINYVNSGNKVGKSQGAAPLMDLPPELPNDIDYKWYIEKTNSILHEIGYYAPSVLFF